MKVFTIYVKKIVLVEGTMYVERVKLKLDSRFLLKIF